MIEAEIILALRFAGPQTSSALADRLGIALQDAEQALDALGAQGRVERLATSEGGSTYRLSGAGRVHADSLCVLEREALGPAVAEIQTAFEVSDRSLKEILHRWQVKPLGSISVPNDHADRQWDAVVLRDLSRVVHSFLESGLSSLVDLRPRYGQYARRLRTALQRAGGDDPRWVAGLDVDSVHGVWWELHEDLLCMLGRNRDPESG